MINYLDFYDLDGRSILLTATNLNTVIGKIRKKPQRRINFIINSHSYSAYDVANKEILYKLELPNPANGVKISPDYQTVAVTSDDDRVYFFSPYEALHAEKNQSPVYRSVKMFNNPTAQCISWDPTSQYVAFACEGDKACIVYDMTEKKIIRRYFKPVRSITDLSGIYYFRFKCALDLEYITSI